jgi:cytochrome c oxidase subunit 2
MVGLYGSRVQVEGGGTGIADDAYLRQSILTPNARITEGFHQSLMPTYQGQLTEDQVIALIAYIKALGARPTEGAESGAPERRYGQDDVSASVPEAQSNEKNQSGGR